MGICYIHVVYITEQRHALRVALGGGSGGLCEVRRDARGQQGGNTGRG